MGALSQAENATQIKKNVNVYEGSPMVIYVSTECQINGYGFIFETSIHSFWQP